MNWTRKRHFGARLDPVATIRLPTFGVNGDLKVTSKTAMVFRFRIGSLLIARMLVQERSTSSILLFRILINPTATTPARGTIAPSVLLKLKLMMENILPFKTPKGCERSGMLGWMSLFTTWLLSLLSISFLLWADRISRLEGCGGGIGRLSWFPFMLSYCLLYGACAFIFLFLPLARVDHVYLKNQKPKKKN